MPDMLIVLRICVCSDTWNRGVMMIAAVLCIRGQERDRGCVILVLGALSSHHAEAVDLAVNAAVSTLLHSYLNKAVIFLK